jgi:hypothetical protein
MEGKTNSIVKASSEEVASVPPLLDLHPKKTSNSLFYKILLISHVK